MKNDLIDIITDSRWMHTLVITFILLSPIVLMDMAPVASPFIAGAVVNEHTNGEVAAAYEFLTQVVGLSNVSSSVKKVDTFSVPDVMNSGWDCEYVDIYLADNSRLSFLVKGGNDSKVDDVVRYSIRTESIKVQMDAETFLQRLIIVSANYRTAYTRVLEVMEQAGVYVGARASYDDILYTVSGDGDRLVLRWSRAVNGTPSFYENYWIANNIEISVDPQIGVVSFGNTWDKYETGSTNITVSKSEALNMTLSSLDEDRLNAVKEINAELVYYPSDRTDPSLLYPCWWIETNYNKTFPNDVTKRVMLIWADNGDVWYNSDQGFYTTSYTLASSYDIPADERALDLEITQYIHTVLSGFTDHYYPTAYKEEILSSAKQNIVFHIGHGGDTAYDSPPPQEVHWFVYDSNGDRVYDNDTYYSSTCVANFVFLWTCQLAGGLDNPIGGVHPSGDPYGFPFAYSHRTDLSPDGYNGPDHKGFAFVGFKVMAPYLKNEIDGVPQAGYWFLKSFYHAVGYEYASINQALDIASNAVWGKNWDKSPLCQWSSMYMEVYGDGSLVLPLATLHLVIDVEDENGRHEIANAIKEELAKIGINVVIEYRDAATIYNTVWGDYWNKTWEEEPYKGWDMVWYEFSGPLEDLASYYLANATPPNGYNIMPYMNPKAHELLIKGMNKSESAERRKEFLCKWQKLYMHDAPCLTLYYLRDNRSRGLAFNLHHPALSNRYVRQAIAHAIPYKTIYTIIQEWGIDPFFLPFSVPLTGGIFPYSYLEEACLYNRELEPYVYDLAKAQQYMDRWKYSTDPVNWALGPVGDADQSGLVDGTDWGIWRTSPGGGTWPDPTGWIYPTWPYTVDPDWDNDDDTDPDDNVLWGANYGTEYPFPGASPIAPSASAEYPAIYVEPAAIEDKAYDPGTEFTVSIWTNYTGSDVWGYEFTLYYNPLVLNVTEVTNGDLITKEKDPSATFISGTFNNALGKLSLTGASFSYAGTPLPLTSGPGILANVTFTVVGTGDSYILFGDKTRLIGVTEGGSGTEYDIIDALIMPYHIGSGYFCNVKPPPTHDLAITSVTTYPAMVKVGEHVNITVVVKNEGTVTEMFEVKVYFDHIHPNWLIGEETGILDANRSVSLTFAWDTTGESRGNHTIIAVASKVIGETDTADNTYVDGTVEVGVRDVVVTSVTTSKSQVRVGEFVDIGVTLSNEGDYSETFDVTAYYDSTAIGTQTVNNLTAGGSTTLTFTWNTAGVPAGTYTIKAVASTVPREIDTADNTYTDGTVTVIAVENIWVNSYTEIERDWTEWGASPWLGDNYWLTMISTSKQKGIHKEFEFQNPTGSGILDVAYLRMRAAGSAELNVGVKIYIWNGVKWVFYWELIPTSKVQQWYTGPDLLGILDTWEKLASAKMYVEMFKTGGPPKYAVACYDCYIRIEYSVP